jgi:hypothetical protein
LEHHTVQQTTLNRITNTMTTTYTFDQLKEDVRKEAEALRVHATQEERGRLDINQLDPANIRMCVYGLCTGNCESPRATNLIIKCAPVYLTSESAFGDMNTTSEYKGYHYSPIEYYIGLPEAKNANLIAFLRGETETLEL